jgi:NACHT domain
MLEWLAAATGIELGKLVLDQVLNLGKSALEDYVKDFFKDCIKGGVALVNADTLKKAMAEAIGFFIKRFVKELQFCDVPETSLNHHFRGTIKRFVRDQEVRPILGKAFGMDCKQIDYEQLQQIWTQQYQEAGWRFPAEEFDWRGVAREYVMEVKGIIKTNEALRALLSIDLQEQQAESLRQLAGINPGFDVAAYRGSLQCSYGYLKLYTLDSTDRADTIKLWNMFIEQTVREALPPMRYELPSDLKRQLQERGQWGADLSPEALENYRYEYFQQPSRKVLDAVGEAQHGVILGDPGAGKSTLLQYLALEWVESKTETLPLLIELREYMLAQAVSFLDFLHRGRGADWQFDQQQLHQYLSEQSTLVMFDGLDEVFDRSSQAVVVDEIIRFAQQYPKAKVLVTSRIIGYNPERFQHAGFRQFTIQSLDEAEVHEFIDRWYDLAMGSDADKIRLKQRLKDAIANSKAIQNLADNPLLLTMMAILNRRQELPRDRADLYDQASRVLLYHWDVDHKRLQLPMDAIGRREKQAILRLVAYEMQAGEDGLKGNLIGIDQLTRVLTDYLREQGFGEPREKANVLIQQLRERNFILCYRGADTYGFVHRTFLEYFCAVEIVNRFEKVRSISFEQLRDEVFGEHWQDETWHEVLRLICGMVDAKFALELIDFLVDTKNSEEQSRDRSFNLFVAAQCFSEVKNQSESFPVYLKMLNQSLSMTWRFSWSTPKGIDGSLSPKFNSNNGKALLISLDAWKEESKILPWLEQNMQICIDSDAYTAGDAAAVVIQKLARIKANEPMALALLERCIESSPSHIVRATALCELIRQRDHDSDLFSILEKYALHNEESFVRWISVHELARIWQRDSKVLQILCSCATNDPFVRDQEARWRGLPNPRRTSVVELSRLYPDYPETLRILRDRVEFDPDWTVRHIAIEKLVEIWKDDAGKLILLQKCVLQDPFEWDKTFEKEKNPRKTALEALLTHYPTNPQTIALLHDRATNDFDEQLRAWAQQQLEKLENPSLNE